VKIRFSEGLRVVVENLICFIHRKVSRLDLQVPRTILCVYAQ
jgi:hypothetical protein